MYGWERRGGTFTDHFAESITDEDVRESLERTRRALVPDASPNESGRGSVSPSETERTRAVAPTTGDDAPDASGAETDHPEAASDDRDASREIAKGARADQHTPSWAEHKRAGAEAFSRGAFRDAADRFERAASAFAAEAETAGRTRDPSRERCQSKAMPAADQLVVSREEEAQKMTRRERDAETLAGLRSNVSAALLRAGDAAGAAEAAERCVAARPQWSKAHFRVGEAAFVAARFEAARAAYLRARECAVRASEAVPGGSKRGSQNDDDVAILDGRIAAAARAARSAATCDEEESSLAAAAEARRVEAERKREASSDESVARLNAEAEERERDPRARVLMREIEALFAEARKTTEETDDADGAEDVSAPSANEGRMEKERKQPRNDAFPGRAALRLLAELLAVEPENFEAAYRAAVLSLREGNTLDAIGYARQCLARAPGFARAADFLATVLETTEEGGGRARGDDAARARVRVHHAGGDASDAATYASATEVEPSPSESEAELALFVTVASNPESPDAWTAFARHQARRGRVSDAVAALRQALTGGPEGKWLRPRSDPALLLTLGFLLHLRGHVAEPASLYASAAAAGGGMVAATLAARVAAETGDDDEDVSRARRDAMRVAFASRAPEMAAHLEALNVAFAAPQFEVAARKHVVATLLSDAGNENVAPPTLFWKDGRVEEAAGTHAFAHLFAGERASWLLKARRRAFEGVVRAPPSECRPSGRVFACGSASEALERFAGAGVGPVTATAQRYVSAAAPATRDGRKITLRLFATLVGPDGAADVEENENGDTDEEDEEDAEFGTDGTISSSLSPEEIPEKTSETSTKKKKKNRRRVFFAPRFAEGFVIRAAPRWLDVASDEDEPVTNTVEPVDAAADADFVVDVANCVEAETWANGDAVRFGFVDKKAGAAPDAESAFCRRSIDWSRTVASARRKAETYFRLADRTAWRERHGESDARAAWRRARLPKLVETAFALDGDGEPWLVDVEPFPSVARYASAARDGVGTALRHLARAHDLCD